MASKQPKEEKTVDDIQWIEEEIPGRGRLKLCSIGDAMIYLGVSQRGLLLILDEHQITRYERGHGSTKYVAQVDLDEVNKLRPASEIRVSPKQLLAEAMRLLQHLQASHVDTEEYKAIAKLLELYQKIKD